jgi:hypothetical protein
MQCYFERIFFVVVLALAFANPCCAQSTSVDPEERVTKTAVYTLGPTRIERAESPSSMIGVPLDQDVALGKDPLTSIVWLKGLQIEAFDERGRVKARDFICHAGLGVKPRQSIDDHGLPAIKSLHGGLIVPTGVDGGLALPPGYAMRVDNLKSSTFLRVQAMNANVVPAFNARYRITVKYIGNEDAQKLGLKNIRVIHPSIYGNEVAVKNSETAPVSDPIQCASASNPLLFTIPPGRHTYLKVLDHYHPIYEGGKVLAVVRHMHAYGESVDLIDQTTGKSVLPDLAPIAGNLVLAARSDALSKYDEGIPIDPTHTYAVKAVYNNVTDKPVQGMAILDMYMTKEN